MNRKREIQRRICALFLTLFLFSGLTLSKLVYAKDEAMQHYKLGKKYFSVKDYAKARQEFNLGIEFDKSKCRSVYRLSNMYLKKISELEKRQKQAEAKRRLQEMKAKTVKQRAKELAGQREEQRKKQREQKLIQKAETKEQKAAEQKVRQQKLAEQKQEKLAQAKKKKQALIAKREQKLAQIEKEKQKRVAKKKQEAEQKAKEKAEKLVQAKKEKQQKLKEEEKVRAEKLIQIRKNKKQRIAEQEDIREAKAKEKARIFALKTLREKIQREEQERKAKLKKEKAEKKRLFLQAKEFYQQGDFEATISQCKQLLGKYKDKRVEVLLNKAIEAKIKAEEKKVDKQKDIAEQKMMLDVAEQGVPPSFLEKKEVKIEKKEVVSEIKRLVKLPPIRQKMLKKVNIDFKDVGLDYIINYFIETSGANIVCSSAAAPSGKKVTIKLKDISLQEALEYILKNQGLTYRVDEDVIWVCTAQELASEELQTKIYYLNYGPGMFTKFSGISEVGGALTGAVGISEVTTLKDILEKSISWPKTSKIVLDERSGAMIVTNTPVNLKTVENILYNLDISPIQIMIEARFIELELTDTKELGIEWKINEDFALKKENGGIKTGIKSGSGIDFTNFSRVSEGLNFTYTGILSYPKFDAILHALQENKRSNTLSSPKITTLNNQEAIIKVVDEWRYPTKYESQLAQYDKNGDGDYDDAGEKTWVMVPSEFVTRDIGILLHVTPSVGKDKETITLSLIPEVSEAVKDYFEYSGGVKLPKFTSRSVSTSVVVKNGDTVVLGGLIKETNVNTKTKVPLLGDIPWLGALFRKESDSVVRKNLLIFVTARILPSSSEE